MDLDAIVRCPRCKGKLDHRDESYVCRACRLDYPVRDGVPSFIHTDARPMDGEAGKPPHE